MGPTSGQAPGQVPGQAPGGGRHLRGDGRPAGASAAASGNAADSGPALGNAAASGNAAVSGPVVAPNPGPAPAPTPAVGFEPAYGPGDGLVAHRGGSSQHATPRRPRRRRRILSTLLIVLGVALMAAAGGMWTCAQLQYRAQDEANARLATFATVSDDPAAPEGPQVDWAALKAVNPDVVGWVQIPGTVVNYPVYQGKDNEQYLHTTAEGDNGIGGQVFLDYGNAKPGLQDQQTMIYGHHLWNGTMFTEVDAMTDHTEFDKHPVVWYATEEATYELEPLFTYKAAATNAEARRISFASGDELHSYLRGLLAQASSKSADADAAVTSVSRVVTLATCDYENEFGKGNGRGLLVCALRGEVHPDGSTAAA